MSRRSTNPRVYAVVLNWNGATDTLRCIGMLSRVGYTALNVVVVDNGSTDDSVRVISGHPSSPTLVESPSNVGFGAGHNLGIEVALAAGADYVWLLNNDIDFVPGTLDELVRVAHLADADIVGPWMFDATGAVSIFCRNSTPLAYFSSSSEQPIPCEGFWRTLEVAGAAVLLSRRILEARREALGCFLDPALFLYCEELDLALWSRANGFHAVTARNAKICHRVGTSTARLAPSTRRYYLIRNRVVVLRRHLSGLRAWGVISTFVLVTLLRSIRHPRSLRVAVGAVRAGLEGRCGKFVAARDH